MKKKILTLSLVVALAATAIIGGTLAYFTDYTDDTVNTFTVGNVDITLDEAEVDEYGKDKGTRKDEGEGNAYKLVPGHTYVKDPTVTVLKGSEPSYVRVFVTFNKADELETLFDDPFLPEKLVAGWDANTWVSTGVIKEDTVIIEGTNETEKTLTYEFRYNGTVDAREADVKLDALFDTFTIPSDITNSELKTLEGLTITVYAEAIQADTLTNETAWSALDAQEGKEQQKDQ